MTDGNNNSLQVQKTNMVYEYDVKNEENYLMSLRRSVKKSINDGFYSFIIFDADNESHNRYADIANYAKQNGFQVMFYLSNYLYMIYSIFFSLIFICKTKELKSVSSIIFNCFFFYQL